MVFTGCRVDPPFFAPVPLSLVYPALYSRERMNLEFFFLFLPFLLLLLLTTAPNTRSVAFNNTPAHTHAPAVLVLAYDRGVCGLHGSIVEAINSIANRFSPASLCEGHTSSLAGFFIYRYYLLAVVHLHN